MAGAEIPAAVIVAAKGVVRFPEISKPGGRAAEVFLIGSMTSWTLAVLGIALLRAISVAVISGPVPPPSS